jgi:PAS domain S-box-containing protein
LLRHVGLRSAGSVRIAVLALIALFSVGGFIVTSETISHDRKAATTRRAEIESVRTRALLDRARAYVIGLGNVLADEHVAGERRFVELVGSTVGSAGLVDALWIRSVGGSLVASYATGTSPALHPSVDVSSRPALAAAVRDPATQFAVSASRPGSLGGDVGFYLVEGARFGRSAGSTGHLAVFVPSGWLTLSQADPKQVAVFLDGRQIGGERQRGFTATSSFSALAQQWRVAAAPAPATGLQSLLPWLALGWPIAAALLAFLVGSAIARRRRAEREAERTFDQSLDMLCVAGLDGYYRRVNPAFERTLGYSRDELLSRPLFEFIYPDDVERSRTALDALGRGEEVVHFENRIWHRDGALSWIEWNVRPAPEEGLVYAAARDVTDRRSAEDALQASRDELRVLADEQAALRRVATLVARGVPPNEVFDLVTAEIGQLLEAERSALIRYEPDGTATIVATTTEPGIPSQIGVRMTLEGDSVAVRVRRTGQPARMDSYEGVPGPDAAMLRGLGLRSSVGAPIVVEGRLWGVVVIGWRVEKRVSADVEGRIAQFTELVATAIANADNRAELTASRARIVAASDETRRRIERDLHDGTQQRLVSLALALRAAETRLPPELDDLREELSKTAGGLAAALEDLQEISRGIHPAILSKGGLVPALKSLARRAGIPVELDLHTEQRLSDPVEVATYYVVSEALTNAAKHAGASEVQVQLKAENSIVEVAVRDDGVGGADPTRGSGLIGLRDRVEALGGSIEITSSRNRGTSLRARIPVDGSGSVARDGS